jgi:hypothetical protein
MKINFDSSLAVIKDSREKHARGAENSSLDRCLYYFFVDKRNDGVPLPGP